MLTTNRIADLFDIRKRFLRSIHLERDFTDVSSLRGYVVTPPAQEGFERLARGLSPKSGQRAWRVTGDYGTGKSSFALALAHLFHGEHQRLPEEARKCFDFKRLGIKRPCLLPVLVTGTRAPLGESLRAALARALENVCHRGKRPRLLMQLREFVGPKAGTQDGTKEIRLLEEAGRYLRDSGKADGIVVILDEMGKFLEFAALHPDRQDIYLLQMLAETAARSGDTPIFVVGLLHQGFHAYAEQLSLSMQKEWDKVAGRFEEILFNQPLEQAAYLIANALNIQRNKLPRGTIGSLSEKMGRVIDLGWYGVNVARHQLQSIAPELFPLHPTVIPVLVRLFNRFGQNERSLYSFLMSNEPFALQWFAEQPVSNDSLFRLHNLYDFARSAFGHRLALQTYRSHWNQIESIVESFPKDQVEELQILKTVAILNLIDSPQLLASKDAIASAVDASPESVKRQLKLLQHKKAVLYYRGAAGEYCLWPHTSVNLERAYQEARAAVSVPQRIGPLIREKLETRPLVARRHYIETGNLRHFNVQFVPTTDLRDVLKEEGDADGQVIVSLCETEMERGDAVKFATSSTLRDRGDTLVAVPQPLQGLTNLVVEVQCWEWVLANTPELNQDSYALEEVSRQLVAARQVLVKRLQSYVGLRQFTETLGLQWFYRGQPVELGTGRALLEKLSSVCDDLYPSAPMILNELINRHELSSAAAGARLRLIDKLLRQSSEPFLGMDPATKPPEMSMYLSVLKEARLHRDGQEGWAAGIPDEDNDPCRVRPVFSLLQDTLESAAGRRVKVIDLFEKMKSPPFGVREGLCPLLLAVFTVIHEQDVAFYDQGCFMKQINGQDFLRLIKAPENFEIQYCRIAGVRTLVFERLFKILNPGKDPKSFDMLDIVRPLCVFAAQLPDFVKKTSRLSKMTLRVRDSLLRAEEPSTLLFQTLPEACGCDSFEADTPPSLQNVEQFVLGLRNSIEELRVAYPQLLQKMRIEVQNSLDRHGDINTARESLSNSARRIQASVKEPQLKAFCLRLADQALNEELWVEAIGSFLCSKPPSKWIDSDIVQFEDELHRHARQFLRVESTLFDHNDEATDQHAMRVSITCRDGSEVDKIIRLDDADLNQIGLLEKKFQIFLSENPKLAIAAATRVIMNQLQH